MPNQNETVITRSYWKNAAAELKRPRSITFAALMIAVCVALSYVPSIPIGDQGLSVTWGFLARSVCAMVCGPVVALVFGFAEDTVSFLINPKGVYFPGYALTTMLGTFLYALFLYRRRPTLWRAFLAKLFTNALNVLLGSLWSAILYGKGYWFRLTASLGKNIIMLPIQTAMLFLFLSALYPILVRMELVPRTEKERAPAAQRRSKAGKPGRDREPWES